jgi:hypothetical protein
VVELLHGFLSVKQLGLSIAQIFVLSRDAEWNEEEGKEEDRIFHRAEFNEDRTMFFGSREDARQNSKRVHQLVS